MSKIYVKTHLKELPRNCEDCIFSDYNLTSCMIGCGYSGNLQPLMSDETRPDWCPLTEVKDND